MRAGAIDLRPGRLAGIIQDLVTADHSTFYCHKTVVRDDDAHLDDGRYIAPGTESMCAGAMIYLEMVGRPTVDMRLGHVVGLYSRDRLAAHFSEVIDPPS